MISPPRPFLAAVFFLMASASVLFAVEPPSSGKIDYTRDIRPILSDNCYHCHGPDEQTRKAKLRLDTKDGLFNEHKEIFPFKGGSLDESDAWQRIISTDEDDQMPPPDSHRKLTPAQIAKIEQWLQQGAPFKEQWSFAAPHRPELPKVANAWWGNSPIDKFIAADLEARNLKPGPEAAKEVLIRRVTFDITGLPPTLAEVDTFLADTSADAYGKVVDRLLASPRYGEHMAHYWLDNARYGDTHGLHLDNERMMWPYRDWVVRAFNENLPYDQFTVWQIAGDQLPNATRDQQIASGFSRCNVTSSEGGAINEEFLFRYAVDRTETAVNVWMGLTAGCAACHDHKFDPISQKEFYSLFAFFNSAADPAMDGNSDKTPPVLKLTTPEQQAKLDALDKRSVEVAQAIKDALPKVVYADPAQQTPPPEITSKEEIWLDDDFPAGAKVATAGGPTTWVNADEGGLAKGGKRAIRRTGDAITQDYFDGITQPFTVPEKGKIFAWVWLDPQNPPKAIMLQWHSEGEWKYRANWGDKDAITFGEANTPTKLLRGDLPPLGEWTRLECNVEDLKLKPGAKFDGAAFTQYGGTVQWDLEGVAYEVNPATDPLLSYSAWTAASQGKDVGDPAPKEVRDILLTVAAKDRDEAQNKQLRDYYLSHIYSGTRDVFDPLLTEAKSLAAEKTQVEGQISVTLVMQDLEKPREAHVMIRGQYDKPGELVKPGVPAIFPAMKSGERATRLDLANWLVSPEHPLTARVYVNRLWQQFFGYGIVKTVGDFGAQGEPPVHPELLDWLAVEFREGGWNIQKMVKEIVMCAAYRQDSKITPEVLEADPENRLLARGPRFRMDAEELRDNALFVGGLLDFTVGGPGVRPYQPERIWEPVGFVGSNTHDYKQDHGAALYRRSLYTFWKRTAPPPSMTTFDAPSRESYCLRRERSNTPLQALLLMNDVQYYEAARALGERMMTEGGITPEERIAYGFRVVTSRKPLDTERAVLKGMFEKQLERYAANPEVAKQAAAVGESKPKVELNPSELASYALVANVILNMDEAVTKN